MSWDKKTTIAEHETFHVKESETNFSDVIKLYEAADGKVVCGEKCARARAHPKSPQTTFACQNSLHPAFF